VVLLLKRTRASFEPSMCGCAVALVRAQAEAYATERLRPFEPGGLDFGRVLEGLHHHAELFGFFL
jgi:hypothetical protein